MRDEFGLAHPDRLFLAGQWVRASTNSELEVIDPAREDLVMRVAQAGPEDVALAVDAAHRAFTSGSWPQMHVGERAGKLRLVAAKLRERQATVARAITREMGAPYKAALAALAGPPALFEYYADLIEALPEMDVRERLNGRAWSALRPVGVVAAIVPWNAPLNLSVLKLAPALAAGCTVVLKSAPSTPIDAMILAECLEAADFPEGVVSVLTGGNDAGEALVSDPRVDKVTFTGSTGVGQRIAEVCAGRIARIGLELGGKSAAILLDDMDVEEAARRLMPNSLMLSGQACSALTRVIVPRHRHDALVEALAAAMEKVVVGDPFDEATEMGPISIERQRDRVLEYVEIGKSEGACLVTGGKRPAHLDRGFFIAPTLFSHVENSMRIAREEIFGPVISVLACDDIDDAVATANDSDYGLYASVFTHDDDAVIRLAAQLRSGNVAKNGVIVDRKLPYGGFKRSGIGREGGIEGLRAFQEQQVIYLS
ncbi:aldehyde dehydrogenase [Croceicoccus ponticola]|uniref:aldehyde dehydrogenase (NAD(+)) n=1 Tax=Croceicoccus ponticola TaxID=2217664 RepID=A0A437H222_9SPHN|nr:aldehyde dehydrogenase [Croceicoccus ponticola]RVQ69674.1 aldehyde dehydrogenase [Croceicoccus ponticola]